MWDRIVVRGREIADSAHRFTVMFIVLFSSTLLSFSSLLRSITDGYLQLSQPVSRSFLYKT